MEPKVPNSASASASASASVGVDMDLPECPVCLQPYNSTTTVPRVLPCGHSACELCISLLPRASKDNQTIRCPACVQPVRFPNSNLGAKSFPKNIDLLRLCSALNPIPEPVPVPGPGSEPKPDKRPEADVEFVPRVWSEDLVRVWRNWILPSESVSLVRSSGDQILVSGIHRVSGGHENKHPVSLFPISISFNEPKWFCWSYLARVMESICQLGEEERAQIQFLLEACSRQRSGICRVLGLWMNPDEEASPLYLVCDKFNQTLAGIDNAEGEWRFGLETVEKFGFGMVGMELCEVVMSFYSEGIVFGCLDMDCFSFDLYGHCLLDLNTVLAKSKRLCKMMEDEDANSCNTLEFLSPEVFVALHEGNFSVDHHSDVWSLGCMLAMILAGDAKLTTELFEDCYCLHLKGYSGKFSDACLSQYELWREKVVSKLEALLMGTKFEPLLQTLSACLLYRLERRPKVRDIWQCIRNHFIEIPSDGIAASDVLDEKEYKEKLLSCLIIGNMGYLHKEAGGVSKQQVNGIISGNVSEVELAGSDVSNMDCLQQKQVNGDFAKGQQGLHFHTLRGHNDCITGLAVGGGYLFSSSFDKTVNVWSLQDFSHIQSLKGHDHRVMAMVVVDETQPLCISGDSASGICVWRIGTSLGQELLQKWYEHNDWRYSGIYSLAISEGYLYSGSGDKSIRAWSLQDYSLASTMTGHNSIVSSLAVLDGVLYSGSWDGTIRLWLLSDHSLLSVLGDDTMGAVAPILSLSADRHFLVSAYENGSIKIWKNEALVKSLQIHEGAIFAVRMDMKWLFTGGWDKAINVQELLEDELQMIIRPIASITCDSVITSLFSWRGMLFVGLSNKEMKVYYYGTK